MRVSYSCQTPLGEGFAIIAKYQVKAIESYPYEGLCQLITPEVFEQKLDDIEFDKKASQLLNENCYTFVGWSNACLEQLKRAKELGMKTILNRASTHIRNQEKILKEEGLQLDQKSIERQIKEYELADYIFVNSADIIESFKEYSPELVDKIRVINNGVDLNKFKPDYSLKSDKFIVLTTMSNLTRKGFKYLLQAWINLNLENAELRVMGCFIPNIKNIKFLGWISEEDKIKEFQQASVFCLPSLEEGQALSVNEAMACGTPVIISDKCGFNQILNKEDIIPAKNVEILKDKILYYYKHREECLNKGKEARKLIEKIGGWERYKKEFLELLKKL